MHIVHIITGLGAGGAENMLYKVLKYSNRNKFSHEVVSLSRDGEFKEMIEGLGIAVHSLDLKSLSVFRSLRKLMNIVEKADLVNTWLYHSDFIGFFYAKIKRKRIIWNIRHCNLGWNVNKLLTSVMIRINAHFSNYVDFITFNSTASLHEHEKIKYNIKRSRVIPNGFELDRFMFDENSRQRIRRFYNVDQIPVLITVGRWNIQKDYPTLLTALGRVKKQGYRFVIFMVGKNLDNHNFELLKLLDECELKEHVVLLGVQSNIPELLSAADLYVSSSVGESFSNSIGEALATELNCIVTDVGESRVMVADAGVVVNSSSVDELYKAIIDQITLGVGKRNKRGREIILQTYDIHSVVDRFQCLYSQFDECFEE